MKKTFIQSAVVWLLAFMIVAAVFAAVSLHDSSTVFAATSGSCGSNTEFNIDADGVMTISGTGTITQQSSYSKYSWYADRAKVKKLIISEGVTNMPNNAFYGMTNLTNVQLPSTISTWGTTVFGSGTNSAGITTLTIAGGAGFIIDQGIIYDKDKTRLVMALRNATGEVNLPASLKSIDTNGMEGCAEVTSISLPEGLETIGAYAFRDVSKIKSIKIPATVTALPNYLFSGCSSLETVELHNGITSIGTYLFDNCTSLGSITVPDGIKTLGGNMFKGCTSLTTAST